MRTTDPEYPSLKAFIGALTNPRQMKMAIGEVESDRICQVKRVYKVNVYGPHVPFDAHSTWLYVHQDIDEDSIDLDTTKFWCFQYLEALQPFSSVTKYITAGCKSSHACSRHYRIGVYESTWYYDASGNPIWGTFGDKALDRVLQMPSKASILREQIMFGDMVLDGGADKDNLAPA